MSIIRDQLTRVILAGIGAVAISSEKSKELVDSWVERGEITVERGKVLNEELKKEFKSKVDKVFATPTEEELAKKNAKEETEDKAE